MDAQQILAQSKKHHFWIISSVVVVVALICWQLARSSLFDEYTKGKGVIEGKFGQVKKVSDTPNHPNDKFAAGVKSEHEILQGMTLKAWEKLHDEQSKVLLWPKIGNDEFIAVVPRLKPEEEIPSRLREQYMNFIREYIPEMFQIVKMRDLVESKKKGDRKGRPGGANIAGGNLMGANGQQPDGMEYSGLVSWDKAHRAKLAENYTWRSLPSTKQVRYAQEDLWIYEAMLQVIAETNKGVTEHMFSNVKRINALDLGAEASKAYNSSLSNAASGQLMGMVGANPMAGGAAPGPGAAGAKSVDVMLDDLRFVNDKYQPIAAGEKLPYAEFKTIPVRFSLIMNQSKITDLLVHCANSPLAIEIRRVRVNPGAGGIFKIDAPGSTSAGGPVAGAPKGNAVGAAAKLQAAQGASTTKNSKQIRGSGGETEVGNNDVEVEVFGLVYVFNQPDRAQLGAGSAIQPGTASEAVPPADGSTEKPAAEVAPPGNATPPDAVQPPADAPADAPANGAAPEDAVAPAEGEMPADGEAPAEDAATDDSEDAEEPAAGAVPAAPAEDDAS